MKIGKLTVNPTTHDNLGNIIEVEVPVECTDLVYVNSRDNFVKTVDADTVIVRLTYSTALDLIEHLDTLIKNKTKDSFCGAI